MIESSAHKQVLEPYWSDPRCTRKYGTEVDGSHGKSEVDSRDWDFPDTERTYARSQTPSISRLALNVEQAHDETKHYGSEFLRSTRCPWVTYVILY